MMSAIGENPYVGAQPLSAKNPLFGRDREVRDLFFLLCKERIVLMYAPSGAGKSSLLEAKGGLLGHLDERFDVWPVTRVNTQSSALCRNQYVLSALLGFERAAPPERMRSEDQLAGLTLREGVMGRWRHPDEPATMLLVFDQFEEIVRLNPADVEGQKEFFRQLGELLLEPSIWALLVMREDYLAAIDPYCRQVPTHFRNRFRLDLLGLEAATKAITETAKTAGRYWDKDAVDWVVNDLARIKVQPLQGAAYDVAGQYVEPLQLQVVCRDLWEKLAPGDVSFGMDDMSKIGNVDMALAGYYRRSVRGVSQGNIGVERAIRTWFGSELISPGHVRGQVLRGQSESGGLANGLIEALVAKHIVRAEKRGGATWYELSHDRLIPAVEGCNGIWFQRNLSDLERRAEVWVSQARNPDLLQTGRALRKLRKWAKANPDRVHNNERAFLSQSGRENRKVWRRRGLLAMLFGALLAGAIIGVEADYQRDQALQNAVTYYSRRAAEAVKSEDFEEAWLYTLAALGTDMPENNSAMEASFGRLMRFEIYPRSDWRERAKIALGTIKRVSDADRILHVATNSDSANYTGAILQQYTDNGFNVYRTVPDNDRLSLNGLFSYSFEGNGRFGKDFTGNLFCVEIDGKRYYAGGKFLVEEAALIDPSQGRVMPLGDSPVIAMRRTAQGAGILTKDGRLRFADAAAMKWRDEKSEWKLPPEGLIGFDVAGSLVVATYEPTRELVSRIDLWIFEQRSPGEKRGTFDGVPEETYTAASILSSDPPIIAYGTASGEVGVADFSSAGEVRNIANSSLHRSAVVQLGALGTSESLGDTLVSVAEDGEVRHINMRIRPPGETQDRLIWQVARESRSATAELFGKWRDESLKKLPFSFYPPQFELKDMPRLLTARSELYGRDHMFQYRSFYWNELSRHEDGRWFWRAGDVGAPLKVARREATREIFAFGDVEVGFPMRAGEWATLNDIPFARVTERSADKIDFAEGYFLDMGRGRWRIGSGGELHPRELRLTSRTPDGELVLGADGIPGAFLLPSGEGLLRFRASPASAPVPIGARTLRQVHYIADPWVSPSPNHKIRFRKMSLNGGGNTIRVNTGEAVTFRAQWELRPADVQTTPENFFLGIDIPEGGFSKCIAVAGGDRPVGQRKSGHVQMTFRVPSKPGWYFLTVESLGGEKCAATPSLHATGPFNAVAAIRVEEAVIGERAR